MCVCVCVLRVFWAFLLLNRRRIITFDLWQMTFFRPQPVSLDRRSFHSDASACFEETFPITSFNHRANMTTNPVRPAVARTFGLTSISVHRRWNWVWQLLLLGLFVFAFLFRHKISRKAVTSGPSIFSAEKRGYGKKVKEMEQKGKR